MEDDDTRVVIPSDMSIDFWIEVITNGLDKDFARPKYKEQLRKVVSAEGYKGKNPNIMLSLYDIIEMPKGLEYGIRGFETLKRDPKIITQLQNPDGLVGYVIATSDSLDELVKLQETIIQEGRFYPNHYAVGDNLADTKKHLASSLLKVACEIAERQRNVRNDKASVAEFENVNKWVEEWNIRLDAHIAIVLAYQATKGVSEETLEALAVYESLAGTYQPWGRNIFLVGLMEAYFKRKHSVGTLSKGEIPEELKAEHNWQGTWMFGIDYDQWFRARTFGEKKPPWEKEHKQREEARNKQKERLEQMIDGLFKDPWEYYKPELELLGLSNSMSYQEARSIYRKGAMQRRTTFIRMDTETQDYKKAMEETAIFLDAWEKVGMLYQSKPINQQPSS